MEPWPRRETDWQKEFYGQSSKGAAARLADEAQRPA
jgi:hypothetical protein